MKHQPLTQENGSMELISGTYSTNTGVTATSYTPNFATPGTYYIVCVSTFTCGTVTSNEVQVNAGGTITTGAITGSPFCVTTSAGSAVSVPFTSVGTFSSYTAQLSDPSGGFGSPTNIGTDNSSPINAIIPANTPTGTGYRIRVISNSPAVFGTDNGSDLIINLPAISITPNGTQNINAGVNGTMLVVTESPSATSREWFYGTVSGSDYNTATGITATSYIPNFAEQGTYYIVCKSSFACGIITSNQVQVVVSATITPGTITGSPFCVRETIGTAISVPFTSKGTFTGNIYTAQLSDAAGSFTSPTDIGASSSDLNAGTISATIPANTVTGTGYRIRVISSNPPVTGSINSSNLTINLSTNSISPNTPQNLEVNIDGNPLTVTETPAAISRVWAISTLSGGPYDNTASTGTTYTPNFQTPGTFYIVCKSQFSCGTVISNEVQVHVLETITTGTIDGSPFCVTASVGAEVLVPFTSSGTFTGNIYTAELSDASGSFSSPVTIGTLPSNLNSGTISASIPARTVTGSSYRIRVVSSNPAVTGSDNGTNLRVYFPSNSVTPGGIQNIDAGDNGATLTVSESPVAISREWFYGTQPGGPYTTTNVITASYTPSFTEQGSYYIVCVSTFACETLKSNEVQINVSAAITTGIISGSPFCAGAPVSVPFTSVGTFTGNTYTAQLSNASGSFASPAIIGTLVSDGHTGPISANIPAGTATGSGYRIRVISSNPAVTGSVNLSALTINLSTNSIAPSATQNISAGANGTALLVNEIPAALSREWFYGTTTGGPYTLTTNVTTASYTPNFALPGTYYVVCISTFSCGKVTSNQVQINVSGTISTGIINGSPFCVTASAGASVGVPFTSLGTFSSNTYTAQLSDASGSFANATNIGTSTSDLNSGTIDAIIPPNTASGTGYRIRVISNSPAITGTDNGIDITINLPEISIAPTGIQNINAGVNGTMLVVTEAPVAVSRVWFYGTQSGGPYSTSTGITATSYIPNFAAQGTYYVVCKSTFACGTITSSEVQVTVTATVTTGTITGSPFCVRAALGTPISVPFTSKGSFTGNIYTAQLSDAAGSFTSPTDIGTSSSDLNAGTISATIPANTATGTGYRIRVISSNPGVTGSINGSPLIINLSTNSIAPSAAQNLEIGVNGTMLTVTETPAAASRVWAISTVSGGGYVNTASTGLTYVPNFQTPGTYYIVCISSFSCGTVISNEVQVHVLETITTGTIDGSPFCVTPSVGADVLVPFTSAGTFSGNTYTVELSGPTGLFNPGLAIGSLESDDNEGNIIVTIPAGTVTGTGYRIRVVSSSPAVTGTPNASNLTINLPAINIAPVTIQNINAGVDGTMLTVTESPAANSREWLYGTAPGDLIIHIQEYLLLLIHPILRYRELIMLFADRYLTAKPLQATRYG